MREAISSGNHLRDQHQFKLPNESSGVPGLRPQNTFWDRVVVTAFIILPPLGVIAALALLWKRGIGGLEVGILVSMYIVSGIGVTVGFHRLFTHNSFETTKAIRVLLAIAGSVTGQTSLIRWVAMHRRHHMYGDHEGDPHSPYLNTKGKLGLIRGFWNAHAGWVVVPERAAAHTFAPDLLQDTTMVKVSRLYLVWILMGLAVPAAVGWAVTGTGMGALLGFLWGGPVRLFVFFNITSCINSVCHMLGSRPFCTEDASRNNVFVALLTFGEGWHNNHHAFPYSAKMGLRSWQLDFGGWCVRALELMGLAWNVKTPTARMMETKRRGAATSPEMQAN